MWQCGACHNYILSLAFIQWAAIWRTHTLFLSSSLSLWLVRSVKKKCHEECGMWRRVLQGWFLIFWFFVSLLQEEVHEQELWCLSQTLSTKNWPGGKWVIGCVFVKAFFEWDYGRMNVEMVEGGKERCGCRGWWVWFERGEGRKSHKWKRMCWFLFCLVSQF